MLTLNKKQWDVFVEFIHNNFFEDIISIVRDMYSEKSTGLLPEEFNARVLNGINKALQYGFNTDEHIIEFMGLIFTWGENFDVSVETPWASEILSWEGVSSSKKILGLILKSEEELDKKIRR